MTAEQVDAQERESFLAWRRDLAKCASLHDSLNSPCKPLKCTCPKHACM